MTRYKGRQSARTLEKDFPHIVETIVPPGGFGKRLDAMYEFNSRYGIRARCELGRRDEDGRDYIRWCFANFNIADAFARAGTE